MKSVKSKRLKAIGLFIVIMALVVSYYMNFMRNRPAGVNSRETDSLYEKLTNPNKVKLDVSVRTLDDLKKLVSEKIESRGALKFSSEEQHHYCLYIYQVDPMDLDPVIAGLSQIGNITAKSEKTNPGSVQVNLAEKLQDRTTLYQVAFQDYNSSPSSTKLERINNLQAEIDTLKMQIANQKNMEKTILYIRAQTASGSGSQVQGYKKFLFDFGKYLLIFLVIAAFLNYGTILLIYLLSLFGIKFSGPSSYYSRGYNTYAGYKGYGGYGSYGYGGSHKRKVKRIYRSKQPSSKESDSTEAEEKK